MPYYVRPNLPNYTKALKAINQISDNPSGVSDDLWPHLIGVGIFTLIGAWIGVAFLSTIMPVWLALITLLLAAVAMLSMPVIIESRRQAYVKRLLAHDDAVYVRPEFVKHWEDKLGLTRIERREPQFNLSNHWELAVLLSKYYAAWDDRDATAQSRDLISTKVNEVMDQATPPLLAELELRRTDARAIEQTRQAEHRRYIENLDKPMGEIE